MVNDKASGMKPLWLARTLDGVGKQERLVQTVLGALSHHGNPDRRRIMSAELIWIRVTNYSWSQNIMERPLCVHLGKNKGYE